MDRVEKMEKRKKICLKCRFIADDGMCRKIRETSGCNACSMPWIIHNIECPIGAWPDELLYLF